MATCFFVDPGLAQAQAQTQPMPLSDFTTSIITKARVDYDVMTSAPFVWTSPWMSPSISETSRGLGGLRFEVWGSNVKFNFNRESRSLTITDGDRSVLFSHDDYTRSMFLSFCKPIVSGDNVYVQTYGGYESNFVIFKPLENRFSLPAADAPPPALFPSTLTQVRERDHHCGQEEKSEPLYIPKTLREINAVIEASNKRKQAKACEAPFVWTSFACQHRIEIWANLATLTTTDGDVPQSSVVVSDEHNNTIKFDHYCSDELCRYSVGISQHVCGGQDAIRHEGNFYSTDAYRVFFSRVENGDDVRTKKGRWIKQ